MYARPFDYLAPSTLPEATAMLAAHPEGKILSGGMSLVPMLKLRLVAPSTIINLGSIAGLNSVTTVDEGVSLGALVTHAETASHPALRANAAALSEAAAVTGDVQVRNWGTTCGSMAHADPAADQPAGALACGATLVASSVGGTRTIASSDFFLDPFTSALAPDEVLVGLRIPRANKGEASAYEKVARRGGRSDFAIAGAAVWVRMRAGVIADARVALTGVGFRPFLDVPAAEALMETDGRPTAISNAADLALGSTPIVEDLFGSRTYRSSLARRCIRRAAERAIANASVD